VKAFKKKLFDEGVISSNHLILIKPTPNANNFWEILHKGLAVHFRPTARKPGFDQLFTIYFKQNMLLPIPLVLMQQMSFSAVFKSKTTQKASNEARILPPILLVLMQQMSCSCQPL
jgi:hypothetical protein